VVGAPMSTVQFFFSLHATHSAQLPFFPFWFLAHDVDVMCAVCETSSPATRHGLGLLRLDSACFKTGNCSGLTRTARLEKKDNEKRHGQSRNRDTRTNQDTLGIYVAGAFAISM
jgi:hypothetical protein